MIAFLVQMNQVMESFDSGLAFSLLTRQVPNNCVNAIIRIIS